MFRRKVESQEAVFHANTKRGITGHFAQFLKTLQQRHLHGEGDDDIYSDDASNNLCSALEAVFLHGLKNSVAQKLTAYVGFSATQDQSGSLSFWSFCAKFTHKDVITQLRGLPQISSEIGLCRAWVRLALNDGLMESYIHSMIVDVKTLAYFYHSYSYLRDPEQPGILKNYLTGLMSLNFKLSFNSSILNNWNNTALQLARTFNSQQAPLAAVASTSPSSFPNASNETVQPLNLSKPLVTNWKKEPTVDDEPIIATKSSQTKQQPASNNPGDLSMFSSIRDVEEIRRLAAANVSTSVQSFSPSDDSSTSQVSCPDPSASNSGLEIPSRPSAVEPGIVSPALYPRPDTVQMRTTAVTHFDVTGLTKSLTEGKASQPAAYVSSSRSSSVIVEEALEPGDLSNTPPRPRSRQVNDCDLSHLKDLSPKIISDSSNGGRQVPSPGRVLNYKEATLKGASKFASSPSSNKSSSSDFAAGDSLKSPNNAGNNTPHLNTNDEGSVDSKPNVEELGKMSSKTDSKMTTQSAKHHVRNYEEICATLPPVKLGTAEQEAILQKVLSEFDLKADRERQIQDLQSSNNSRIQLEESHNPVKTSLEKSAFDEMASNKDRGTETNDTLDAGKMPNRNFDVQTLDSRALLKEAKQSDHSLDESSKTMPKKNVTSDKNQIEEPEAGVSDILIQLDKQTHESEGLCGSKTQSKDLEATLQSEPEKRAESPGSDFVDIEVSDAYTAIEESNDSTTTYSGSYGNSLGGMVGWSSEMEGKEEGKKKKTKPRAESYGTLFQRYSGQQAPMATSLDQVLEGLLVDDDADSETGSQTQSSPSTDETDNGVLGRQDSCLSGFEVVGTPTCPYQSQKEADSSKTIHLFRVPREHGLSHQNFTCKGCSRPIGIIYGQPRLCEFDGGLYCYECHQNNETYIPSAIIYDWDFKKKKVCLENYSFLQDFEDQAIYDLDSLNPKLETHVPELKELKDLRQQLCYLKSYLFSCSQKVAESLRQKVWPREHLYERTTVYSVTDLLQVQSGALQKFLKEQVRFASKHVYECLLCSQKGFICEICQNPRVIYSFELDTTIRCSQCKSVFHKSCMTESSPCPKCMRWGRKSSLYSSPDEHTPDTYDTSLS